MVKGVISMADQEITEIDQAEPFHELTEEMAGRLPLDASNTQQGLAKLVLTLIELIGQLLERQALSRMERGTLTDEEIEHIGETLYQLQEKIDELCAIFGLKRADLNIDLGPLGNIL